MDLAIIIVMVLICVAFSMLSCYKTINVLQLESYRNKGFFSYLKRTGYDLLARYFAYAFFAFTSMFVYVMCLGEKKWFNLIGFLFYILISAVFVYATIKESKKTPLKFTARVTRLYLLIFIFIAVLSFLAIYFPYSTILIYSLSGILPLFVIPVVLICNLIMLPIENRINAKFMRLAKKKLTQYKTVTVGITGSYGKTTAKNILEKLLKKKFDVFSSPKSYNTPMGLSRAINEGLAPNQIFIAEMGARYRGDIAQLVDMIHPDYGVITSIGEQHLESFKTLKNVVETKFELSNVNKTLFLNADDKNILSYDKIPEDKVVFSGKEQGLCIYRDVEYNSNGVKFNLILPDGEYNVKCKLLGDYVPNVIALCSAVAFSLGVEGELIAKAIEELEPIEHRLELIKTNGATIIDDAYNGNPSGAKIALNVLSRFEGTKVIITPGLVELGSKQDEYNEIFGREIAKVCNYAMVVGPNAKAILKGIGKENTTCKAKSFESLKSATQYYVSLNLDNPVVLFENDLPDNY